MPTRPLGKQGIRVIAGVPFLSGGISEQVAVLERFTFVPRPILVAEINPLTKRRVGAAPQTVEKSRSGHAQVLGLQTHETHRRRMIILGDLQPKAIRLV